jgi:hypothetical protein
MTVRWNAHKGFAMEPNHVPPAGNQAGDDAEEMSLAEMVLAMRKVPDVRASVVSRGRKLLANPDYPPPELLRKVAELLARNLADEKRLQ